MIEKPEEVSRIKTGMLQTTRTWKISPVDVEAKDGLTSEPVQVKTLDGPIALLGPPSAIAWFGQKKCLDGKWGCVGCFKQGFFVNKANLKSG